MDNLSVDVILISWHNQFRTTHGLKEKSCMEYCPKALGRRLREARENLQISQVDAASHIGVPRTAITHIEAGNRTVSTFELAELAALYGRPIAEFFEAHPSQAHEDPLLVLFRSVPGASADDALCLILSNYVEVCREGRKLEKVLGTSAALTLPDYNFRQIKTTSDAVQQGEQAAVAERRRLGLGNSPIPDMADLISSQGIRACGVELPDEVSGLFLHDADIGMAILVNMHHPRGRKRFSYAHEYAHAMLDRRRAISVTSRENSSELIEKRANAFAASLLLPSEGVQEMLSSLGRGQPTRTDSTVFDVALDGVFEAKTRLAPGSQAVSYRDAAVIAAHFKVSYQATVYRLRTLRYINPKECKLLLEQESSAARYLRLLGLDVKVSGYQSERDPRRELRSHILRLAVEARACERIQRDDLARLVSKLGLPDSTVDEIECAFD